MRVADSDTLYGDAGNDTFGFRAKDGIDTIQDFTPGEDIILFSPELTAAVARAIVAGVVQSGNTYTYTHLDATFITTVALTSSFTGSPAGNPRVGVKVLVRRADRKGA